MRTTIEHVMAWALLAVMAWALLVVIIITIADLLPMPYSERLAQAYDGCRNGNFAACDAWEELASRGITREPLDPPQPY